MLAVGLAAGSDRTALATVPAVVDQDLATAEGSLRAAGFLADAAIDAEAGRAGVVREQQPPAGTSARKGSHVVLSLYPGVFSTTTTTSIVVDETTVVTPPKLSTSSSSPPKTSPTTIRNSTTVASTTAAPPTTVGRPSTGNLVSNPGAEGSAASPPFSAGVAPSGWQRQSLFPIAAAYGSAAPRSGCYAAEYPPASALGGSGNNMFTGGYDGNGGCGLTAGNVPALTQVIPLSSFTAGQINGAPWVASALLGNHSQSGDSVRMTIEVLRGDQVRDAKATSDISGTGGVFRRQSLSGTLASGDTAVRVTLAFTITYSFSGSFADDISFKIGP